MCQHQKKVTRRISSEIIEIIEISCKYPHTILNPKSTAVYTRSQKNRPSLGLFNAISRKNRPEKGKTIMRSDLSFWLWLFRGSRKGIYSPMPSFSIILAISADSRFLPTMVPVLSISTVAGMARTP